MDFKTRKPKLMLNMIDNIGEVTFQVDSSVIKQLETLTDRDYIVEIKAYSKKRTHSQNSYLWVLLDQIGKSIGLSKETVYKQYIRDYGVFEIVPIKSELASEFIRKWESGGLGNYCVDMGEAKLNGYSRIMCYFGSSTYNSEEMKRLLEAVINDCEEMGIATKPLNEILMFENIND